MFSRKNTIIIALIAIFVLGSIILHADTVDIQVSNVYSRSWGHDPLSFDGYGWIEHEIHILTGDLYDLEHP